MTHLDRLAQTTQEDFMEWVGDDTLDFDYLIMIAKERYLEGQKKYGKVRKLDYSREAFEEIADYINYKLFAYDETAD